eukprot:3337983-Prymnesium_polylepis.1
MPPYTIGRSSTPQKPPALSKDDAVRLWFANRQLQLTNKAVVQSKERHKTSASAAMRRCSELESRLSEIERRASNAERRVQYLTQELAKCEKHMSMHDTNVAPHILRQKVISLEIGTFRVYFPGACLAHSVGTDVGVGCSLVW